VPVMNATFPSMKSKILAQIMMKPASTNRSVREREAGRAIDQDANQRQSVRRIPSATLALMMARSGNMEIFPTVPVNVSFGWGSAPARGTRSSRGAGV
jgi:hypothetical protein